jgi:hypothetical protein
MCSPLPCFPPPRPLLPVMHPPLPPAHAFCAVRVQARRADSSSTHEEKKAEATTQADELISIRQLRGRRAATAVEVELDDEADITKGACAPLPRAYRGFYSSVFRRSRCAPAPRGVAVEARMPGAFPPPPPPPLPIAIPSPPSPRDCQLLELWRRTSRRG